MPRSQFSDQELRLEAERCLIYRGTARIRLEVLYFQQNEPREPSRKNVERLKKIFGGEKGSYQNMRRLDPRNHIVAKIAQSDLDNAVLASDILAPRLLDNNEPPLLKFPEGYRLLCLHGQHRILAAREILPPTDAWWTVNLFLPGTPEFETSLVEEYSSENKPSDGEIYRKVRQYEREGNICLKKRWKAWLSDHGRRGLQKISTHGDGEFQTAFDKLLDIPGQWSGFRFSTVHKILGMRCDPEALKYLELILNCMEEIFGKEKNALRRVDQATIKALEGRVPRYSKQDSQALQGQLLSGQICSLFSPQEREMIWSRLRSVDYLVPSLYTFFEDVKYLNECADCLKRLVNVSNNTICKALDDGFPSKAGNQYVIERAESVFVDRSIRAVHRFDLGYRQLWIFAMRHYQEIPMDIKKKSKDLLAKAGFQKADEEVLSRAANLAYKLGFVTEKIKALKQRSPDEEIARNALLKARKPDHYQYDLNILEKNVADIVNLFTTATPLPAEDSRPHLVCDNPKAAGNRCGFPDQDAYQQDSKHLFISHLHHRVEEQGDEITSFFVRQSVYFAFFGRPVDIGIEDIPDILPSPPPQSQIYETSASQLSEVYQVEPLNTQRIEQERAERGRVERERAEQERAEQERAEQERAEQETAEQERAEREGRLHDIEMEQMQSEMAEYWAQASEQGQVTGEEEVREQEIITQEDIERGMLEHKASNRHKIQQSIIHELQEKQRQTRQEQHRQETLNLEKLQAARQEQEQERWNLEKRVGLETSIVARDTPPRPTKQDLTPLAPIVDSVWVTFKYLIRGVWETSDHLYVYTSDTSELERIAMKYMRKQIRVYDIHLNPLTPRECFQAAIANRGNMLLLIHENETHLSKDLEASVSQLLVGLRPESIEV